MKIPRFSNETRRESGRTMARHLGRLSTPGRHTTPLRRPGAGSNFLGLGTPETAALAAGLGAQVTHFVVGYACSSGQAGRGDQFEIEALRRTPIEVKVRQLRSLMTSADAFGSNEDREIEVREVRERWLKLHQPCFSTQATYLSSHPCRNWRVSASATPPFASKNPSPIWKKASGCPSVGMSR